MSLYPELQQKRSEVMPDLIAEIYSGVKLTPDQLVRTLQILEHYYPSAKLDKFTDKNGTEVPIDDPLAFASQVLSQSEIPMIYNDRDNLLLSLAGYFLGEVYHPGTPIFYLLIQIMPSLPRDVCFDLLGELSETLEAYWGALSAKKHEGLTHQQFQAEQQILNHSLPRLMSPSTYSGPEVPAKLGWINYWSFPTMGKINPENKIDLTKLKPSKMRRTASGATIAQLTPSPLDVESPSDLAILSNWYSYLTVVGNR